MKSKALYKHVWAIAITPFTDDNKIDFKAIPKLMDWYINNGCDGVFANCQSSEMDYLSENEKEDLAKAVIDCVDGRVPVVVSGHTSRDRRIQLEGIERVAKLGIDGYVLVSNTLDPENKGDEVFLKNYYETVNAFPHLKFGVYECPTPYKRLVTTEALKELAENGLAFMKDTSCDPIILHERLDAISGTGLKLMNANGETFLDSWEHGCAGYNGPMTNFHPQFYRWMLENYETDYDLVKRMSELLTVYAAFNKGPYPMIAKYHMNLCGVPMGLNCRSKDISLFNNLAKVWAESFYSFECYINNKLGIDWR